MTRPTLLSAPAAWLDSDPTRWYLVFCDTPGVWWWDLFTRRNFRHVFALRWDGWNWLLFDPSAQFTDVAIISAASEDALGRLVPPGATVLEVEAFRRRDRIRGRWWIGPMTCVEQVKALLGLPVGWVFTPWQLYRYLSEAADGADDETGAAGRRAPKQPGYPRATPARSQRHCAVRRRPLSTD
jgi:hypothetical protein